MLNNLRDYIPAFQEQYKPHLGFMNIPDNSYWPGKRAYLTCLAYLAICSMTVGVSVALVRGDDCLMSAASIAADVEVPHFFGQVVKILLAVDIQLAFSVFDFFELFAGFADLGDKVFTGHREGGDVSVQFVRFHQVKGHQLCSQLD